MRKRDISVGSAGLLNAGWAIASGYSVPVISCLGSGCPLPLSPESRLILLGAAALLGLGSLVCIFGVWFVFPVEAVLSGAVAVLEILYRDSLGQNGTVVGASLSVISIVLSVMVFRSKESVPEESSPMNLPVFG